MKLTGAAFPKLCTETCIILRGRTAGEGFDGWVSICTFSKRLSTASTLEGMFYLWATQTQNQQAPPTSTTATTPRRQTHKTRCQYLAPGPRAISSGGKASARGVAEARGEEAGEAGEADKADEVGLIGAILNAPGAETE